MFITYGLLFSSLYFPRTFLTGFQSHGITSYNRTHKKSYSKSIVGTSNGIADHPESGQQVERPYDSAANKPRKAVRRNRSGESRTQPPGPRYWACREFQPVWNSVPEVAGCNASTNEGGTTRADTYRRFVYIHIADVALRPSQVDCIEQGMKGVFICPLSHNTQTNNKK
jgi:hypothetical protein